MFKPHWYDRTLLVLTALVWSYGCFEIGRFRDSGGPGPVFDGVLCAAITAGPLWALAIRPCSIHPVAVWLRLALLPVLLLCDLFAIMAVVWSAGSKWLPAAVILLAGLSYLTVLVYRLHCVYGLTGSRASHS